MTGRLMAKFWARTKSIVPYRMQRFLKIKQNLRLRLWCITSTWPLDPQLFLKQKMYNLCKINRNINKINVGLLSGN